MESKQFETYASRGERDFISKEFSEFGKNFTPLPHRTIEWLGGVNYTNLERVLEKVKNLIQVNPNEDIHLIVNSFGGATGIAMNFYDTVNSVLKIRDRLVTIGSGDVDSSGIIILLSGSRRFLTQNTTLLLHLAGRTFEAGKRFSTLDMEGMLKEDKLKDFQYACAVADGTFEQKTGRQKFSPKQVLDMMAKNTILTASEAVRIGLAQRVL